MSAGRVLIVGAGPGDPGLLTLRGLRALERADVVVYDHLVGEPVLDRLPWRAERVYAGKQAGAHILDQAAINALLVDRARRGQIVVRLKGGDPFVFGRGGEEAAHLAAAGIPFEIVPGVSSVLGATAYAGIPVTHRGVAASLAVVTGRAGPIGEAPRVDWARVAGADTVVILMGIANHEELVTALVQAGRSPDTPAAVIRWGTTARQQLVQAPLGALAVRLRAARVRPPAILVVGEVAGFASSLGWTSALPLFGSRALVPAPWPSALGGALEDLGAEVAHAAWVHVAPGGDTRELDDALAARQRLAGIVFADALAVEPFFARLGATGRDARALAGLRLAAEGPATRRALAARAIRPDVVLDTGDSGSVPEPRGRWLLVAGADVRERCLERLADHGVHDIVAPRVAVANVPEAAARYARLLAVSPATSRSGRLVDAMVFGEAAEVDRTLDRLDAGSRAALGQCLLAAADAGTAAALAARGLAATVTGGDDDAAALAAGLALALGVPR